MCAGKPSDFRRYNCQEMSSTDRLKTIRPYWIELSRVWNGFLECEPDTGHAIVPPWESDVPEVQKAWLALTDPKNLAGLEHWAAQCDMNPTARKFSDKALKACRERVADGIL